MTEAHDFCRDNWAKNTSPNKNVKVYIGAPASSTAAGSGYVDASTLGSIAVATRNQYSSFGGVMLWDASQAYGMFLNVLVILSDVQCALQANGNFAAAVKNEIKESGSSSPTSVSPTTPPPTTSPASPTTTTSAAPTSGPATCSGVSAWQNDVAVSHLYSKHLKIRSSPSTIVQWR